MSSNTQQIAMALAGKQAPWMNEPGLEQPPEMKALQALNTIAGGYGATQLGGGIAQVLSQQGLPALQGLGEAGAIFPENMKLPQGMVKGDLLTPSEQAYTVNEMNEKQYLNNDDFVNALKAKWGMLKNAGGN